MIYLRSLRTWIFVFYVIAILFLSIQSSENLGIFSEFWKHDKIIHFIEYLLLGFLLINALIITTVDQQKWKYSILFLLIFPIIDELLQYYTPTRITEIMDAVVDICGGITGAYIRKIL